ncbi:MAG: right-handed parallel beta-helix repeat-containing protein, partial [Proteobacteria bacterium]|nr:right-handed parallel beta-helix repeat-containing protein [Pseudomonadota bacterium]
TLHEGVELRFGASGQISIGNTHWLSNPGGLIVDGGSEGVLMTSSLANPQPGSWDGLTIAWDAAANTSIDRLIYEYADELRVDRSIPVSNSTIRYNSDYGIHVSADVVLALSDSRVEENNGYGLLLDNKAALSLFEDNVITGNTSNPISMPLATLHLLDSTSSFAGNDVDPILVLGGTLSEDVTWRALDVPYEITTDVYVQKDNDPAVLTLEDGVRMLFATNVGMYVGNGNMGDLVVDGDRALGAGVEFGPATDNGPGSWKGLYFGSKTSSTTDLSGFVLHDAGQTINAGVYLNAATVAMSDCLVSDNVWYGLYSYDSTVSIEDCTFKGTKASSGSMVNGDGLFFNYSNAVTMSGVVSTGNERYPVSSNPDVLASLGEDSNFAANGIDAIHVQTGGSAWVGGGGLWRNYDMPYLFAVSPWIGGGSTPLVEIESGVTTRWAADTYMNVGYNSSGNLIADGVTFTAWSDNPQAGDWWGIRFSSGATATSSLTDSTIEYSGDSFQGAILLEGTAATISGNFFQESSGYGIYCSQYFGSSDLVGENFFANNGSGDVRLCQ